MNASPRVSVVICAYNHGPFLGQCLESVVAQRTRFEFEAIVAEDCSPDDTRAVLERMAAKHPSIIKPLYRDRNLGPHVNGQDAMRRAGGAFMALLDGDDYWTDPLKLQKQADFLEAHPDCSACFHRTQVVFEDGSPPHPYPLTVAKPFYTIEDVIRGMSAHTSSLVFRREAVQELPPWFAELKAGDWSLQVLAAARGPIGFLDEFMSVYRVHASGIWTHGASPQTAPPAQTIERVTEQLKFYDTINRHFDRRHDKAIRRAKSAWIYDLVWAHLQLGNVAEARRHFWKAFRMHPANPEIKPAALARFFLATHAPALYQCLKMRKHAGAMKDVRPPAGGDHT